MRIVMIHNRWGANTRGGAERVVERLVAALRERGHEVVVATCDGRPSVRHITHAAALRICHLRALNIVPFDRLGRLPAPLRAMWHLIDLCNVPAAWSLVRLLKRVRPDAVHTHNLIGCGGFTPLVLRRSRIPWIHTLHDVQLITPSGLLMHDRNNGGEGLIPSRAGGHPPSPEDSEGRGEARPYVPSSSLERSLIGRWFRAFRRRLFGSPDVVTSPSRWLLQLHHGDGFFLESCDAVIGNPIDGVPTPTHSPSLWEGEKRGGGAVRRFCFVGQVEGVKGVNVLVEAFRRLHAIAPDVTLQIIGNGALLPMLKRTARDVRGLILRGRLDANGVRSAIAESDVLVVPSLCAENQPSAILEAYAAGIPVIASRVGGIPEIIRPSPHEATEGRGDGETGFLVDPGSVDDLLRALRACVEDPQRVRAMSVACRAVAAEHATSRVVAEYERAYVTARSSYAGT